jgi:hypothetical protein
MISFVTAAFIVPGTLWFWPHCARPALVARRADPFDIAACPDFDDDAEG